MLRAMQQKMLLAVTHRGHKLFVPDYVPTGTAITRLQQYIYQVRPKIQDEGSTRPMTHTACVTVTPPGPQALIDNGLSPLSTSLRVSQLLGHEWPDVTRGYLASIKNGADGK